MVEPLLWASSRTDGPTGARATVRAIQAGREPRESAAERERVYCPFGLGNLTEIQKHHARKRDLRPVRWQGSR